MKFGIPFLRKQESSPHPFLRKQESSRGWYRHGFRVKPGMVTELLRKINVFCYQIQKYAFAMVTM